METDHKLKYILVTSLGLSVFTVLGHDVPVHQAITLNAAESALDASSAYTNFVNAISSDLSYSGPKGATNAMVLGSGLEDNLTPPIDEGGYRSVNHFYDPLDISYSQGLSDSPPDRRVRIGLNSFNWGSVSNCLGYNFYGSFYIPYFGKNINTSNKWSWPNARG